MSIVLQLTPVERETSGRPQQCKYCNGEAFQRWGQIKRHIKDTKIRTAEVYRYRCNQCKRTFRHYPEGVSPAQQSERLKKLAVICWSLGLSYRSIVLILSAFDVSLSRMSGWRDVQAAGEEIRHKTKWKRARVVGVDGAWLRGRGIMVAVDLGDGKLLSMAQIDEKDMPAVKRWLRVLKQQHGIGAVVTDDLAMYRGIAEQLGLGHQVCYFHLRRWAGRACRGLSQKLPLEWLWMTDQIKHILEELPPDGSKRLLEMYQQLPGNLKRDQQWSAVDELRHLLIRLSDHWDRYTAFFLDPGIPWTNNRSEQAIGRMKMRAYTTRGYKTESGMLNGLLVSGTNLI